MPQESDRNKSISRRKYLTAVGIGTTVGLAGCAGGGGGGGDGGDGGDGGGGGTTPTPTPSGDGGGGATKTSTPGQKTYTFGFSIKNMNNPWLQVFRRIGKLYAESLGHEMQVTQAGGQAQRQIQNVRSMLSKGIDGLVISPYSSDAAVGVIESATEQGVPVYTANSTAPTKAIPMFIGFGSFNAGYRAGQKMVTALKDTYGGSRVVDLVGDPADQSAVRRSNGFKQAIKEADGVSLAKEIFNKGWSQQKATQNLGAYLEKDSDIDGIYAVWGGGALAAVNVLRQQGMLYKRSNTEKYIPIMNIDGFPGVLDAIRQGYVHTTLQQPMPFYAPLALEYIIQQLETGSPPVPSAGSKVSAASKDNFPNKVNVKNFKTSGVRPLSEPYWAPGKVTDWSLEGTTYYPWLKPKTVAITEENVDAGYLWGNYASAILE